MTENSTPFHVVDYCKVKLHEASFQELPSRESWAGKIHPGGKYWTTRNGSAMIAFTPVSAKPVNEAGCIQLGVAPYAAGLNPTWWDRDLGIAGRVVVRNPDTCKSSMRLVKLGWPVAKIATVAAHLSQLAFFGDANLETRMALIIGLASTYSTAEQQPLGNPGEFVHSQPPELLYDFQPAQVFGMRKELITAGRLDDKLCSWAAMIGLLTARAREDDGCVRLVSLFDNEEIGGKLRQGHGSTFLPATIERMVESLTHSHSATTPYGDHVPTLNTGIAIKHDPNGGFSTDAVSAAVLMRVAELIGAKVQLYQARNDERAGGSIGPILSSVMGCRATDAGIVQLSMQASTGALDPGLGVLFYKGFLENWEKIDSEYAPWDEGRDRIIISPT
ncbi:hypothetical protein MY1884_007956 [Beauveria asiatica]